MCQHTLPLTAIENNEYIWSIPYNLKKDNKYLQIQ